MSVDSSDSGISGPSDDVPREIHGALLAAYFTGTCTDGERAEIERWRQSSPGTETIYAQAYRVWQSASEPMREQERRVDVERVIRNFQTAVARDLVANDVKSRGVARHIRTVAATIAGVVTALVVMAVLWQTRTGDRRIDDFTGRTYTTTAGQRAIITLRDGSRVTLAANTALTLSRTFGDGDRRVALVGEAYFDVAHVTAAPFVVHTGRMQTRVTGTAFDVRHYPAEPSISVAVVTGKVVVAAPRHALVPLTAGTIGHLTDSTAIVVRTNDMTSELSWTRGALAFRDAPLADVLRVLNRWYDVDLRVADTTLSHRLVTGTFDGASRAEALLMLQSVLHVGMTYDSTPGKLPIITLVQRLPRRPSTRSPEHLKDFSHTSVEVGR